MFNSARIARKALIVLAVTALALPATYFAVARSKPAEIAEVGVRRSAAVVQRVGSVRKIRLALTGYSVVVQGDGGHAHIPFEVTGRAGRIRVDVDLTRSAKQWAIVTLSAAP